MGAWGLGVEWQHPLDLFWEPSFTFGGQKLLIAVTFFCLLIWHERFPLHTALSRESGSDVLIQELVEQRLRMQRVGLRASPAWSRQEDHLRMQRVMEQGHPR